MKILFVTNQFHPPRSTGSGNSSSLIYKELKRRGHDVNLLIFDHVYFEEDYKETRFGKFYKKDNFINTIRELSKIKDGEYDIIHNYGGGYKNEILPLSCRDFEKTKIVVTFNGIWPACWSIQGKNYDRKCPNCCRFPKKFYCAMEKRKLSMKGFSFLEYFYRHFQRMSVKKYDKYIVLSKSTKTLFSKAGFDKSKMTIVPNFYDPDLYKIIKNENVKKKDDNIVILHAGGIKRHKGFHQLIEAFKMIKNEDVELQIMGTGAEEKRRKEMNINDNRIKFLGKIPYKSKNFVERYKRCDIFVHSGIWPEPFGRTILEAAISKNAIIVSDIGAPPEVLGDKALIYEPHNIQELKEKLIELIDYPEKRNKLAERAYKYIIKEYSVERSIDKLETEYEKLLKD